MFIIQLYTSDCLPLFRSTCLLLDYIPLIVSLYVYMVMSHLYLYVYMFIICIFQLLFVFL